MEQEGNALLDLEKEEDNETFYSNIISDPHPQLASLLASRGKKFDNLIFRNSSSSSSSSDTPLVIPMPFRPKRRAAPELAPPVKAYTSREIGEFVGLVLVFGITAYGSWSLARDISAVVSNLFSKNQSSD